MKKTKVFNWTNGIKEEELEEVIHVLENDGVIIFPTDTVYGIGCNCFSEKGIEAIFQAKNRARNKPINVLTDSVDKMKEIGNINSKEEKLITRYMPGALTIIVDKKEKVPNVLTAGLDTVGVRIPKNDIALKILKEYPYPVATTSANVSGEDAGIKVEDFKEYFDGLVDIIIDGGETEIQIASTIVRVEDEAIKVLREGSIKIED